MFNRIVSLHRNEAGNESMQTVMIMAVGALIMLAINALFKNNISTQVTKLVDDVLKGAGITMGKAQ